MQTICVFCGASAGDDPAFSQAARDLGQLLAERQLTLVYGGGNIGLMGVLADAVLDGGGRVIGVIPKMLVDKELAHHGITDLRIVGSMHQRKALMAELAEGFITLPGGYGTLEEFGEVLTWGQLGLHAKPMGLLNVAGYYDPLLQFFDRAVHTGLLRAEHRALVLEATSPEALLHRMIDWHAKPTPQWIAPDQT